MCALGKGAGAEGSMGRAGREEGRSRKRGSGDAIQNRSQGYSWACRIFPSTSQRILSVTYAGEPQPDSGAVSAQKLEGIPWDTWGGRFKARVNANLGASGFLRAGATKAVLGIGVDKA